MAAVLQDPAYDVKFFRSAQHHVDAGQFGNLVWLELCVAARHHYINPGISSDGPVDDVATLPVGVLSYTAGIDDEHIGTGIHVNSCEACFFKLADKRGGLGEVEFTAKGMHSDGAERIHQVANIVRELTGRLCFSARSSGCLRPPGATARGCALRGQP